MSKGLEALNDLIINWGLQKNPQWEKDIEKELKDYYALKKECEEAKWYHEHKALEIINDNIEFQFLEKKENNQVRYIVRLINFDNPSQCFEWDMEKEKYDLLKEVLL